MSKGLELTIHGAARTVTGSCFELSVGKTRVLVDCGMFQGSRSLEALNRQPFGFDPRKIDAVLLTHAHIDHSGLLPRLVLEGFSGDIWCTGPTADLLDSMLPDSGRIQEAEAMRRNRRPDRRGETPARPIYGEADAGVTLERLRTVALEQWFEPAPGIRARFWNAGHILGSGSVELETAGTRLLFSGDLGPDNKAFHPDPRAPGGFDHVLCESTYGDRDRDVTTLEERRSILEAEVKSALARGGNLVVPVFAVERTQELLLDLATLIDRRSLPHTDVFIDSPLAGRVTGAFVRHAAELEDVDGIASFRRPAFRFVEDPADSMKLNTVSGAVILAASGMCEAGRVRHHLLHNLPRSDSTVLFVGFQAAGTLGRAIIDGARRVRISGHEVPVKAAIRRIDSYSAHADRSELLRWVGARAPIAGSLLLTHGEPAAIEAMRHELQAIDVSRSVVVPEIGERYALSAGRPARRLVTGRAELRAVIGRDWQNDYADLAANLKDELQRIGGEAARREAIARMRAVLREYCARDGRRSRLVDLEPPL